MDKFIVIDGNSLINRAFYALPPLKSLDGRPCNAVYGFINMMLSVITSEKPKYLVCVFDAGKHTFRHNFYAEYKAGRDKMPEDLATQLPILKELLKHMNIKTIEMPEIEADDIIGSLTRKFDEEFLLVSGDKDLLQLINKNTTVCLTQKGISNMLKVDENELMKTFEITPEQVIELKSIMGDSSDNIPGVPGIGKVGAMKLLKEYGSIDNVYENIENITGSTQKKLIEGKESAYLSHKLATIKLDVDIDFGKEDCELKLPFGFDAYDMMRELDFKSIITRKEFFTEDEKQEKIVEEVVENVESIEIDNQEKFNKMMDELPDSFALSRDEFALILAYDNKEYSIYLSSEIFQNNIQNLRELFECKKQKICFDCKHMMHDLIDYNIRLNNYFDVSVAIYIANELDAEISLEDALKLNNIQTTTKVNSLIKLKEIYLNKLINNASLKLYSDIELPLVEVLFDMENVGLKIDREQIKELSAKYHEELKILTEKIYVLAGCEFNINSPKQMQEILFEKLNLQYKGKKGTGVEVLNAIKNQHEIVDLILRYRKVSKLISTYLDGMLNYISTDEKIHTTFMQKTTSTGRLSSREPNLQNLPIRDDEGKILRKMFYSSFDKGTLVSADYNQIELRLMANFSQDENMISDYKSGKDIHTATASKIFGVPINSVTSNMRRIAKSVNFGIIYGISAYGLSQGVGISTKEASEFISKYLESYPKVKTYGDECIERARKDGYISTIMGRTRHIPDINSGNHMMRGFAERTAKNTPLQGSASDIIKIAMNKVFERLRKENLKSKLVLQIHDELIVDCAFGESEIVKKILKEEMENVIKLEVPLIVEVSEGKTLFDAK
ncbi:MAG: DNA polymerase I [Clostridia bacterium]|nr:DNA polymerase I [Clostridia bacterium]